MEEVKVCCKVDCRERFSCAKFARALDVNSGKIRAGYVVIGKCEYEKS